MKYLRLLVLLLILSPLAGAVRRQPQTLYVEYNPKSLNEAMDREWNREFRTDPRFADRDLVLLSGHGATTAEGVWSIFTDDHDRLSVAAEAERYKAKRPDYVIVAIVCNPAHTEFKGKGVAWAKDSVWSYPDSHFAPLKPNRPKDVTGVGKAQDFSFTE